MILLDIKGGLVGLTAGAVALSAPEGRFLHRKSGMIFVYAMLVLSASGAVMTALGDARLLLSRGIPWAHRIARHLWRMCFVLWIAAGSFLGRQMSFRRRCASCPY